MDHLDEGALQAYLDGEGAGEARKDAAAHLLACGDCRARLEALKRTGEQLRSALADLDVPAPAAVPRRPFGKGARYGFGGGTFIRAAVLVLVLAAAASASVPGSPVRKWIEQVVRPAPVPEAPAPADPAGSGPDAGRAPAGVAVAAGAGVDVVVRGFEGDEIRLVPGAGETISVTAEGARQDPTFAVGAGAVEVRGGLGGALRIEVPGSVAAFRLIVDGRPYAEMEDGTLRVLESGRREGDVVVWP